MVILFNENEKGRQKGKENEIKKNKIKKKNEIKRENKIKEKQIEKNK